MAIRYDVVEFRKPERTPQGFLRADAVLTRSGVFLYQNPDGTPRREYRPPDEVFRADSLGSFEDAPVTKHHPAKLVDPTSARSVSVGSIKEAPRRDGNLAIARVVVTDADAIARIESGELRAVSCGYTCEYDPTPGMTPDGERYDGVQREIIGNHLALVPAGRAGPEAHIRLDADDAIQMIAEPNEQPKLRQGELFAMKTKIIRIDSVDFEVPEQSAQAIERELGKLRADAQAQAEALSKLQGRADQLEDDLKKERAARSDASTPAAIANAVKARVELLQVAQQYVQRMDNVDELTDIEIKKAVVLAVSPEAKLDGKDNSYIEARYDQAIEQGPPARLNDLRAAAQFPEGTTKSLQQARLDALKRESEMWKSPLTASKDARN